MTSAPTPDPRHPQEPTLHELLRLRGNPLGPRKSRALALQIQRAHDRGELDTTPTQKEQHEPPDR